MGAPLMDDVHSQVRSDRAVAHTNTALSLLQARGRQIYGARRTGPDRYRIDHD